MFRFFSKADLKLQTMSEGAEKVKKVNNRRYVGCFLPLAFIS